MPKVKSKYYIITDASKRLYGVFTGNKIGKSEAEKYCDSLKKDYNLKVMIKLKK
jgi:hypothetical protein